MRRNKFRVGLKNFELRGRTTLIDTRITNFSLCGKVDYEREEICKLPECYTKLLDQKKSLVGKLAISLCV